MCDIPQDVQALLLEDNSEEIKKVCSDAPDLKHRTLRMAAILGMSGCAKVLADGKDAVLREDHQSWTSLHHAAHGGHADVLATLLTHLHGRSVDVQTDDVRISRLNHLCGGLTPLHLSAGSGTPSCVKLLLDSNADPSVPDNNGWTTADHAKGTPAVIELLPTGPQSTLTKTAYDELTRRRNEERMANLTPASFQQLLEDASTNNPRPLNAFLRSSDTKNVRVEGSTLLQSAIALFSPDAVLIILEFLRTQGKPGHDPEAAKLLPLPTLHDHDPSGVTPLHTSAELSSLECMTPLLEAKVDINLKTIDACNGVGQTTKIYNEGGRTALHIAIEKGRLEIVECLIQGGANVLEPNSFGVTPRQLALERVTLSTGPQRQNRIAIAKCLDASDDDVKSAEKEEIKRVEGERQARQKALQQRIGQAEMERDAAERAQMRECVSTKYCPLDKGIVSGELGPRGCDLVCWMPDQDVAFSRSLTQKGSRSTGIEEPFPGVFVFDLMSASLCARIWDETENYLAVAEDLCLPQPVRHDGCLDLSNIFPNLLAQIVEVAMPAIRALLPPELHDIYLQHAFRTKNFVGREETFKRHVDKYAVTLNVCLRKTPDVVGSGVFFYESDSAPEPAYRHEHSVGLAVLHSSKEYHQTEPLISGERGSVIMWFSHR